MKLSLLKSLFKNHRASALFGRYIHTESIEPILKNLSSVFEVESIGFSVNRLPIHSVTFGNGDKKILMWSQMHGNESTTTKAVFDLFNVICMDDTGFAETILETCTVKVIPILNPDGAKAYTRLNANEIDLNRDAQDLSQPESKVLRRIFDEFKPDFCFNLHGQRTIFSAGMSKHPATVSFLAPAQDIGCTITSTRKIAMSIIVKMNTVLQKQIKNQVGIYDDAFNLNCVGDMFQSLKVPTILFEAGHFSNDYQREETRKLIFQSLLVSIHCITNDDINEAHYKEYQNIPKNEKQFFDIIIRNSKGMDIAIQFQEELIQNNIEFVPKVEKISDLKHFYGHIEIDANGCEVYDQKNDILKEGSEIVFVLINNEKFSFNV